MLAELLIASTVTLTVLAVLFGLLAPAGDAALAHPASAEMDQRMRGGFARLHDDLVTAGAGHTPDRTGILGLVRAPVLAGRRSLASGGFRRDAVSLVTSSAPDAGAVLTSPLDAVAATAGVTFGLSSGCRAQRCGIDTNATVLIFDATGRSGFYRVTRTGRDAAWVRRLGGHDGGFPSGAAITPVDIGSYYFRSETGQLRYHNGWRTDLPVLDGVAAVVFRYYGRPNRSGTPVGMTAARCLAEQVGVTPPAGGALVEIETGQLTDGPWCGGDLPYDIDLFRLRSVRVEVRLHVAALGLRGRDPGLFARPGLAAAGRLVPDRTARFEVALRGLTGH